MASRPDGKKKAYVRLTADHDALDVANKVSHAPNHASTSRLNDATRLVSFKPLASVVWDHPF